MILSDETYILFAARAYHNVSCQSLDEFEDDLAHTIHIKKILTKYSSTGEIKTRLIVNHLISFFNVFDNLAAVQILFFKIPPKHHTVLKTVLVSINRCPDFLKLADGNDLREIAIDDRLLVKISRELC